MMGYLFKVGDFGLLEDVYRTGFRVTSDWRRDLQG